MSSRTHNLLKPQAPATSWAGFDLDQNRPLLMGIVNVTPDSFSDGGQFQGSNQAAIAHGLELRAQGASILDVGGESTRPGAKSVSLDEECARVLPVIKALAEEGCCVSVDTRHATVMREAVAAGASIINDVCALQEPESLFAAAQLDVPVVLMHMQGQPQSMQANPQYDHVVTEIRDFLIERAQTSIAAGIKAENLCLDPGIGFGKSLAHNLELLRSSDVFVQTGYLALVAHKHR